MFFRLLNFVINQHRMYVIKYTQPSKKILTVTKQIIRGNLSDEIISLMIDTISTVYIDTYPIESDIIQKCGLVLAKHGTPDSCLLAIFLSNYTDVKYNEHVFEILTNAACEFKPVKDTSRHARTIEIVRGKFINSNIFN